MVHAWTASGMRDFAWTSRQWAHSDSRSLLRTALVAARQHAGRPVEVVCRSVEGDPAAMLVAFARRASLLVLGAHIRRNTIRLGSIDTYCARHLTIPIAVIAPDEPIPKIHNGQRWPWAPAGRHPFRESGLNP